MVMDFFFFLGNKQGRRVKVPTVLQMEATECGAASLAMILAHYGLWIPLEKLRAECGVNRDGSKASNVMRAAKARGCEVHGYRWEAESLRAEQDYPLIIHWEFNHFLVLEGIIGDTVYLNDQAMGRRTVHWDEFVTSYTGIALTIRPAAGFKPAGHRYNVFKAVAEKLWEDKWGMTFLILLGLCMIVPGLAAPVFSQVFLDDILTGKHRDWMVNLCLAMTVSFIVSAVLTWLRAVLLTHWQRKLTLADSSSFFWHLLRLPMQFFHQRYAAEVAGRISMNESVAGVLSGSAATAVLDAFVALFFLLLLLQYNMLLTLIGILFMAMNIAITACFPGYGISARAAEDASGMDTTQSAVVEEANAEEEVVSNEAAAAAETLEASVEGETAEIAEPSAAETETGLDAEVESEIETETQETSQLEAGEEDPLQESPASE